MGGIAPNPGKSSSRALDASLNLVPFIDLLSCCLAFLLITAVWTQLASIDAAPSGGALEGSATHDVATLFLDDAGYRLLRVGVQASVIPRRGEEYDYARLAELLRGAQAALPESVALSLRASDGVRYLEMIRAMDIAKSARFRDIAVSGGDGG
jgi:biopolymer transport protein TolR